MAPSDASHTGDSDDVPRSPLPHGDPDLLDQFLPAFQPTHRDSPYPFTDLFDGVYGASPTPPSFFDNILNPAGLDHGRYSPFVYAPSPPGPDTRDMPPATRARPGASQRPARLPNGYVDLTSTPDSPPPRRKRDSSSPGPSKRARRNDGSAAQPARAEAPRLEDVDLTDDRPTVHEVLQKQREDAVKAQAKPEETATTFNSFTCVICMDTPTDLSATACGHLFCHTCLMEALIAGENRTGPGETKRSQCPVCRKFISRTKATDIIPLLLKQGLSTQPRKKVVVTSSTVSAKV